MCDPEALLLDGSTCQPCKLPFFLQSVHVTTIDTYNTSTYINQQSRLLGVREHARGIFFCTHSQRKKQSPFFLPRIFNHLRFFSKHVKTTGTFYSTFSSKERRPRKLIPLLVERTHAKPSHSFSSFRPSLIFSHSSKDISHDDNGKAAEVREEELRYGQ